MYVQVALYCFKYRFWLFWFHLKSHPVCFKLSVVAGGVNIPMLTGVGIKCVQTDINSLFSTSAATNVYVAALWSLNIFPLFRWEATVNILHELHQLYNKVIICTIYNVEPNLLLLSDDGVILFQLGTQGRHCFSGQFEPTSLAPCSHSLNNHTGDDFNLLLHGRTMFLKQHCASHTECITYFGDSTNISSVDLNAHV